MCVQLFFVIILLYIAECCCDGFSEDFMDFTMSLKLLLLRLHSFSKVKKKFIIKTDLNRARKTEHGEKGQHSRNCSLKSRKLNSIISTRSIKNCNETSSAMETVGDGCARRASPRDFCFQFLLLFLDPLRGKLRVSLIYFSLKRKRKMILLLARCNVV